MIARYTLPPMAALWSDAARYERWLKVELAVLRAQSQLGQVPNGAYEAVEAAADAGRPAACDRCDLGEASGSHLDLSGARLAGANLSGARLSGAVLAEAVSRVQARGQVVVAAVGNDGPAAPPLFPASYEGVVGVTAIDLARRIYRRAGRGAHVDFSAPGVRVRAASVRGGYASMSGTSFATPVVAALIALRISGRTPQARGELSRLSRSVLDLGAPGKDEIYGHGLLVIDGEP